MFVSEERSVASVPLVLSVELVDIHVPTVIVPIHVHLAKIASCDKTIYTTEV